MRLLSLLILLNCCTSVCGQITTQPEVMQIADSIAANGIFNENHSAYSINGRTLSKWYVSLKETASTEELRQLVNHPSALVRCISFRAYSKRCDSMTFSILKDHLTDNEMVLIPNGCIMFPQRVGDYFIQEVTPRNNKTDCYYLSDDERSQLDSLVIFTQAFNWMSDTTP